MLLVFSQSDQTSDAKIRHSHTICPDNMRSHLNTMQLFIRLVIPMFLLWSISVPLSSNRISSNMNDTQFIISKLAKLAVDLHFLRLMSIFFRCWDNFHGSEYKSCCMGILISSLCLNVVLTYGLYVRIVWFSILIQSSKIGSSPIFKIPAISDISYDKD